MIVSPTMASITGGWHFEMRMKHLSPQHMEPVMSAQCYCGPDANSPNLPIKIQQAQNAKLMTAAPNSKNYH